MVEVILQLAQPAHVVASADGATEEVISETDSHDAARIEGGGEPRESSLLSK